MSRIGKLPVKVPNGVTVAIDSGNVSVKGPKGQLTQFIPRHVAVSMTDGQIVVARQGDHKAARANHGLARALFANMVKGVTAGFTRDLEIIGVGYRAELKGQSLVMHLGYSHPIDFPIPKGIAVAVDKANKITVSGIDKQHVGLVAAKIRGFRSPDSYKGKGIRYVGETVRLKAGKTA